MKKQLWPIVGVVYLLIALAILISGLIIHADNTGYFSKDTFFLGFLIYSCTGIILLRLSDKR